MYYITGRFSVVTLLVNFYYITACFIYYITGKSYYITGRYYIIGRFLLHYWSILRYRSIITLLVVTHDPWATARQNAHITRDSLPQVWKFSSPRCVRKLTIPFSPIV